MTRALRIPRPSRGPKWLIAVYDRSGRMLGSVRFFNDSRKLQPGRIRFSVLEQLKLPPITAFEEVATPKCYVLEVELKHFLPTAVLIVDDAAKWHKVSKLFRQHGESHLIHGPFF